MLDRVRADLGEEVWTLQFWPFDRDGLGERTTLMFNIRNEGVPLPGLASIAAPPLAPDEGPMKPETNALLEGADQAFRTATALRTAGFNKPAAREAYQAVLRAARALIFELRNQAPKTHNGTVTLFSEVAIKSGRMAEEFGLTLSRGLALRMDVDYEPIPKTSEEYASEYVDRAGQFIATIKSLIA
jgi:uncharacterized protein (UPF0332 family)